MSTDHIYDAVVLGAGFGGLGQGAQFVRDGITDFVILEKADDLGGVWRDNTYPGAACDTQTPIYCYSYFLNTAATRLFAPQSELLDYLRDLADEYGLEAHLRLNHEVTDARWHDAEGVWTIVTADGAVFRARTFLPAWGQLSLPSMPRIEGLEEFEGIHFHSSRWDHSIDFAGKRVASIGNAATAVQYVPEIAPAVQSLTVFQRSANYILPRNQEVFSPERRRRHRSEPASYEALRSEIHQLREDGFERTRVNSSAAEEGVQQALAHLEAQVPDAALRAKLVPDYDFGCKRILRSDDYYPALTRSNVELVTTPIERILPEGIRTVDGVIHDVDVIVFATGFRSQAFQGGTRVTGRHGVALDERWGASPEAHLGMAVDGFPNMFLIYGPNTNLNHNSVVTMLEAQHRYIAQAVRHLKQQHVQPLDVESAVLSAFSQRVQNELANSAFSSECSSWYKNADGRVINNWCGTVEEYRTVTRELKLADYGAA